MAKQSAKSGEKAGKKDKSAKPSKKKAKAGKGQTLGVLHPDSTPVSAPDAIGPEYGPGFVLWQVTNQWQRALRAQLDPLELTYVQYLLLDGISTLSANTDLPVTQARLAGHCRTDVMMTSQVVRALEKSGLVTRIDHPTDRRAKHLSLTRDGQQRLDEAAPALNRAEALFFEPLGKKREKLQNQLEKLWAEDQVPVDE